MVHFVSVPDKTLFDGWKRLDPGTSSPHRQRKSTAVLRKILSPLAQLTKNLSSLKFIRKLPRFWNLRPAGVVTVLLVSLLLVVVVLGVVNQNQKKKSSEWGSVLSEVTHKYDEGVALIDLNPVRARELLGEAKALLESIASSTPPGREKRQIEEFLQKITESLSAAVRRYEIPLTSFFELGLIKPEGAGDSMSLYQDTLIIFDSKNRALYRLSISSKSARVISDNSELAQAKEISVHGEDVFVIIDGIKKVTLPEGRLAIVVSRDDGWGSVVEIAAYAGNLYLLDSGKNQIWKYVRTETGFSERQDYLLFDTLVDLSGARSLAIDGHVWLVRGGEVIRFAQGQEYPWKLVGFEGELGQNLALYTDDTTKNVYILDDGNKRVIVADKDGVYLAQYVWREDVRMSDMVVSEVAKKILLLSGDTIYGIDLK